MHFYLDRKGNPPKIKLWEFFYGEGGDYRKQFLAIESTSVKATKALFPIMSNNNGFFFCFI